MVSTPLHSEVFHILKYLQQQQKKTGYFSFFSRPVFPLLPHALSLRAEAMGLTELLHCELLMETSQTAGWIAAIQQGVHSRGKNTGTNIPSVQCSLCISTADQH